MEINVKWQGGLKFSGTSLFGHPISTDAAKESGGNQEGYKPTELLFFGLAGCTGIDVVKIAEKMRQEIVDFQIKVVTDQRESHPRAFTHAHIEYIIKGKNLNREKLEQAVKLSEEKYCSVGATISGVTKITHTLTLLEA